MSDAYSYIYEPVKKENKTENKTEKKRKIDINKTRKNKPVK